MPTTNPIVEPSNTEKKLSDRLKALCEETLKNISEGKQLFSDILDRTEQGIYSICLLTIESRFKRFDSILPITIENLQLKHQAPKKVTRFPKARRLLSGISYLDNMVGGFQPRKVYIIGGRLGMGKTALALNILTNVAKDLEKPVGLFSLEISEHQASVRIACMESSIDSQLVMTDNLSKNQYKKLIEAANILQNIPIFIDDTPRLSINEIKQKSRRLVAEHGIELLVIDYLQLIKIPDKMENRLKCQEEVCSTLMGLTMELNIPVLVLTQLSGKVDSRKDKRPLLSDILYHEHLEEIADVIMFLYRPWMYYFKEEEQDVAELIIAKNNTGPTGIVPLRFFANYGKFE